MASILQSPIRTTLATGREVGLHLGEADRRRLRSLAKWGWLTLDQLAVLEPDDGRDRAHRRESIRRRLGLLAGVAKDGEVGPLVRASSTPSGRLAYAATRRGLVAAGVAMRPVGGRPGLGGGLAFRAAVAIERAATAWTGREVAEGVTAEGAACPVRVVGGVEPPSLAVSRDEGEHWLAVVEVGMAERQHEAKRRLAEMSRQTGCIEAWLLAPTEGVARRLASAAAWDGQGVAWMGSVTPQGGLREAVLGLPGPVEG